MINLLDLFIEIAMYRQQLDKPTQIFRNEQTQNIGSKLSFSKVLKYSTAISVKKS